MWHGFLFNREHYIVATKAKTTVTNRISENGEKVEREIKTQIMSKIVLPEFETKQLRVRIVGDSPLIVNRFKEATIREIADKQAGAASAGRKRKDPKSDYEGSIYKHSEGGYGFPCSGFAKAAVSACTSLGKSVISQTQARQAFRVMGDMAKIQGKPQMREDVVKVGKFPNKVADLRYRAEFPEWSTTLTIRFNARVLTAAQIINLFQLAGFAVGVGEWRPEKSGQFGMFHVEPA
jgi:hypothetical protein